MTVNGHSDLTPLERVQERDRLRREIHARGSALAGVLLRAHKDYTGSTRPLAKREARAAMEGACKAAAALLGTSETAVFMAVKDAREAAGHNPGVVTPTSGTDHMVAFITWEAEIREDIDRRLASLTE